MSFADKAVDWLGRTLGQLVSGAALSVGYRHAEQQFRLSHHAPEITTSSSRDMVIDQRNVNDDRSVCRNRLTCQFHGPDADDYLASHAREFQTRWLQEHVGETA